MYSHEGDPNYYLDDVTEPPPPPPMNPGDVYFFSANSYVLCVKRTSRSKHYTPYVDDCPREETVTPKNYGLNPNAHEFYSKVPSPISSTASGELSLPTDGDMLPAADNDLLTDNPGYTYMNGNMGLVDDVTAYQNSSLVPEDTPPINDATKDFYDTTVVAADDEPVSNGYLASDEDGGAGVLSVRVPVMVQTVEPAGPSPAVVIPAALLPAAKLSPISPVAEDVVSLAEESTSTKTDGPKDLRRLLRDQLEYYFSPENLASDSYLYSQMDADHFVAITTIANFNMVKRLTGDLGLIVDVLKESPVVQVDEAGEKVRPLHKRCIVILREVPQSTPVKTVKDLFSGENCPRFLSCEFAINNSWYITFDSDEDAQRAYRYLREERQTFLGKPIMARIKAKPLLRSTYVPKNGVNKNPQFAATQFSPQPQPVPAQVASAQTTASATPAGVQFTSPPTSSFSPPMSGLSYINSQSQQTYSTFFPSSSAPMVPAWPASPPFFDPGMVFAVNGYQAQATFKHASTRPFGFQNIRQRNQPKPSLGRNHSTLGAMERSESQRAPLYDRQHSAAPAPLRPSGRAASEHHGRDAPPRRGEGSDRHNWREAGSAGYGGGHASDDRYGLPPRLEKELRRPLYRGRGMGRRQRDDDSGAIKQSSRASGAQPSSSSSGVEARIRPSPPSPRFELEPTNFPPLPGAHNSNMSGDVFENKMSDVVRGTVKPSTQESRPQKDHRPERGHHNSPIREVPNGTSRKHALSPNEHDKRSESSPEKGSLMTASDVAGSVGVATSNDDVIPTTSSSRAKKSKPSSSSAMTSCNKASIGTGGALSVSTNTSAIVTSKCQKSQSARDKADDDQQSASPPIPARISYAQMVSRAKGYGSDSDSGPLSPAAEEDSCKEESDLPIRRPRDMWELKDESPEQRASSRRSRNDPCERSQYRSPNK